MKKPIIFLALCLIAQFTSGAEMSDEQKTFYAMGMIIGKQTAVFNLDTAELESLKKGLTDTVTGQTPIVDFDTWGPKVRAIANARREAAGAKTAIAGKAFVEKAAKEPGAIRADSGLVFRSLQEGTGASPAATDVAKVNYRGTLTDGTEFDSSYKHGAPAELPLDNVIKCWAEGIQKMKVGGKARLTCPPEIAYGDSGAGPIPPKSTLSFEVELLSVSPPLQEGTVETQQAKVEGEVRKNMAIQMLQSLPQDTLHEVLAEVQKEQSKDKVSP